ncbi:MAG TPA: hypothetical protein VMT70_19415 [Vicinamibacteria bacterium]|nr:hypothetical protein [Vicinamibacteria bacterium]
MGLEDDLKARTSALISQQMANWVVEIQRAIQGHQASLVRALDELGETVARYDEKVDEQSIAAAVAEVLAQQPPPAAAADYSGLKASLAALDKGANLSEVLTHLVGEVTKHIERAAMFILKNNAAVGWYARGFDHNDVVKSLTIPLTADTVFRVVHSSRHATRGHVSHSPGTAQALSRLGGDQQGIIAVPLILRDKVAAVLYCDTPQDEVPPPTGDLVEIMVAYAGKVIDVLSGQARAAGPGPAPGGTSPSLRPAVAPPPVPPFGETGSRAAADPSTARAQAAATVLRPPTTPPVRPSPPPAPPAAPAPPPPRGLAPEDQKAHDDAKRFARLVVSEIKLYNEAKVTEGRKTKDIYERLKEDIERGRQMYHDRVPNAVRDASDYFHDELVRILAGGDPNALGPM